MVQLSWRTCCSQKFWCDWRVSASGRWRWAREFGAEKYRMRGHKAHPCSLTTFLRLFYGKEPADAPWRVARSPPPDASFPASLGGFSCAIGITRRTLYAKHINSDIFTARFCVQRRIFRHRCWRSPVKYCPEELRCCFSRGKQLARLWYACTCTARA